MPRKNKKTQRKNIKTKSIVLYIVFGLTLFLGLLLISVVKWSVDYFGVGLEQIIFTLNTPMKGAANTGVIINDAIKFCLPIIVIPLSIYAFFVLLDSKIKFIIRLKGVIGKTKLSINLVGFCRVFFSVLCVTTLTIGIVYADDSYDIVNYIKSRYNETTIYEDYYVDPRSVNIAGDSTKNLICVYLESMETSYASVKEGGFQEKNLIPNLTELADTNISFSNNNKLGGFYTLSGASWTMGSLFTLTSGVPYHFPVEGNSMGNYEVFAGGIQTLGDVLNQKGYVQEFLCGSDAAYAGRKDFFETHGNYKVFDYYSAIGNRYINEDYHVFWGIEDKKLYEIAKDELIKLSSNGKPFNFSMLTVDTHFPGGYECELCKNEHQEKAANVVSCADRQIKDFIDWCKKQSFYKDTVIVILGDHPRMEQVLVPDGFENKPRTIYNCIINSAQTSEYKNYKNRTITAMDYFPTVLSAMGFNIQGNRLGLGTNLLSAKQTLPEELGLDIQDFNNEISKYSEYYIKNFS